MREIYRVGYACDDVCDERSETEREERNPIPKVDLVRFVGEVELLEEDWIYCPRIILGQDRWHKAPDQQKGGKMGRDLEECE